MQPPMNVHEALQLALPIIEVLARLGIPYRIGGSVAGFHYGLNRATQDIDLIADIPLHQVQALVGALDPHDYLIVDQSVVDAILHHSSFNIIGLQSMNKVDVFIHKQTPYADQEQQRAQQVSLVAGMPSVWLTSVEDTILEKILWWQLGGNVSTRQWADIVVLIQNNATSLDRAYLQTTATTLQILPYLSQAYANAGVAFP